MGLKASFSPVKLERGETAGVVYIIGIILAWVYFAGLFGWALLHALFGDRWWWLFLLNSFAVYFFLPLPVILALAFLTRRCDLWVGFGAALVMGIYLYGGLFLPKFSKAEAHRMQLTVMSYNLLGFNQHPERVVDALRSADADVVALQELNPLVADAISRKLASEYPYQILDPQMGVTGLGVISKYPLHPIDKYLPGAWMGRPQVLALDVAGRIITLLHFHAVSVNYVMLTDLEWSVRGREQQAREIVDFVADHPGPLIVLGDLNAGDQSSAYATVTNVLRDSWREGGWGLGHTFPGANSPASSRPVIAGITVPMWLVRIDYIFHSYHWQTLSAWIGPWDGVSDHRPVVARLTLTDDRSLSLKGGVSY
jgi:vancomycin resistance protein VanJ